MNRKKRNEIFLIAGLLLIIFLSFAISRKIAARDAGTVEVSVSGHTFAAYPLDKNTDQVITGESGGTNRLVITDGSVSVTEASCPDKVCVRQGIIRESGQTIVCLPNKMTVTIK